MGINEQLFLAKLHHRVPNRCIPVRVVLHRIADHIGHLVIAAVLKLFHRVQNPALHRLQTITKVRHCTLHDYVTCVIKKVVSIHATKVLVLMYSVIGVITACKI